MIVGAYEKETKGTVVTHRVHVGDSVLIETKNNVASTLFLIKDHLGSPVSIIDSLGTIKERLSYDPWGKRRAVTGATINLLTVQTLYTDRGYTGHLHADGVGLIHMNGRMYDPILARLISADPLIQSPNNLQSLNRYSYVMNNPLSYTDPTGYSWSSFRDKWLKPIAVVALAIYTGGLAATAFSPTMMCTAGLTTTQIVAAGAASGAVMGGGMTFVKGGSFKDAVKNAMTGGVTGAVSGAMFGSISNAYGSQWTMGRVGLNATAGGASSIMNGGSFKDGAKMAGIGALTQSLYSHLSQEYNPDGKPHLWQEGKSDVGKQLGETKMADIAAGRAVAPLSSDQSALMKNIAKGPYMDAFGEFHDGLHDWLGDFEATNQITNSQTGLAFTMPHSYAITVTAAASSFVEANPYLYSQLVDSNRRK